VESAKTTGDKIAGATYTAIRWYSKIHTIVAVRLHRTTRLVYTRISMSYRFASSFTYRLSR
jgi:hypothetical protein